MQRALGAQISHMLKDRGVSHIFGIPGVHNQELYRGIEEAGITHILARNEMGAGFMADGYARATGRPGVAYVITGPGLCNIMTPMGQAYSDGIPMLVISSCLNRADLGMGRGRLHEMKDQRAAADAVCDWSKVAMDAQSAYALMDRALYEFENGARLPKHIMVPIEVLEAMAPPPPATAYKPGAMVEFDVADLAHALTKARRPLFVFGPLGGADAGEVLARSGAAAFSVYDGRGALGTAHLFDFGSNLARASSADVAAQADLVVAVGTDLSEVHLWRDALGHDCPLIRIDESRANLSDTHRADRVIEGRIADVFAALSKALPETSPSDWSAEEVARWRKRWFAEIDAERPGILPVIEVLRSAVPADALIYSDMTQIAYAAKEVWDMPKQGLWHHPYGFGTLGYGMPAALGGAIGQPDHPVLALIGDSGFQYTLQELGTLAELGLNVTILLWDNGKLGEIEASMTRAQIAPNAVIALNPEFLALAAAYGIPAQAPETLDALKIAVAEATSQPGPCLIRMTPALTA